MTYFTENPWPLAILLAGCGIVFLLVAPKAAKVGSVVCFALAGGVFLVDRLVETPAEMVTDRLMDLAAAVESDNADRMKQFVAANADEIRDLADEVAAKVDVQEGTRVKEVLVTPDKSGSGVTAVFRANGNATYNGGGKGMGAFGGHFATRWRTHWVLENETWVMDKVERLDVLQDRVVDVFSSN